MSLPDAIRRAIKLPMTRAALNALPGFDVGEDDGRFAEALARLDEVAKSKPTSIWDDVPASNDRDRKGQTMADELQITRRGGCLCGAVRYEVRGAPLRVGVCHCQECRQTSGSAFSAFAIWPRDASVWTGELKTYGTRGFCPTCGSRVAYLFDDEAEIMLGTLDDGPSDLVPEYELWIPRREPWLKPIEGAHQFNRDRN